MTCAALNLDLNAFLGRARHGVNDRFNAESATEYDLRYSVGSMEFDGQRHGTVDALLHEADQMMYSIKKQKQAAAR